MCDEAIYRWSEKSLGWYSHGCEIASAKTASQRYCTQVFTRSHQAAKPPKRAGNLPRGQDTLGVGVDLLGNENYPWRSAIRSWLGFS